MCKFKKGDIVRLVKGGMIDWEGTAWWEIDGLEIGGEYTVNCVANTDNIVIDGYRYTHHQDHFELVEKTNNYIVKLNQDEVDALIDAVGLVNGDTYSIRRYTDNVWTCMFENMNICSFDPCETSTKSTFRFLK
jgi:hypothetical protein